MFSFPSLDSRLKFPSFSGIRSMFSMPMGFGNVVPFTGDVGGWVELGRTTLGGTANTITVTGLANKRYYHVLGHSIPTGSTVGGTWRVGNGSIDTGSNYAWRRSLDGAADSTGTSATYVDFSVASGANDYFVNNYIANFSSKEKMMIGHQVHRNSAGAANAPQRSEHVGKWTNTSSAIDQIQLHDGDGSSTFAANSEIVVLGWDPADTHTTNFWTELASADLSGGASDTLSSGTFTSKKYLWVQWFTDASGTINNVLRVGNGSIDAGTNYTWRHSQNGAADNTGTNDTDIGAANSSASTSRYGSIFIVNVAAQEKLIIGEGIEQDGGTGAGTAPQRIEFVGKWTNTSNQIDVVAIVNKNTGDLNTNSIIKVWGSD